MDFYKRRVARKKLFGYKLYDTEEQSGIAKIPNDVIINAGKQKIFDFFFKHKKVIDFNQF